MRAVWESPMRAIDTTNKKTITHTEGVSKCKYHFDDLTV